MDTSAAPQNPPDSSNTRHRNALTLTLGVLGVLGSWALFVPYLNQHGWSTVAFWIDAFTTFGVNGLTVDLFATAFTLFVMIWHDRKRLGPAKVAALVFATVIPGVCLGLPLWLWWRNPE